MEENNPFVELLKRDRRFKAESYRFIDEALRYAQNVLKMGLDMAPSESDKPAEHHVRGQDLSRAVKEFAIAQYGYLARPVLAELGIRKTEDIGRIVYNLIEIGYMKKTPDEQLDDFRNLFDLGEELDKSFTFRKKSGHEKT